MSEQRGWVKSYEVQHDKSVILTCHNPAGDDLKVRISNVELVTIMTAAGTVPVSSIRGCGHPHDGDCLYEEKL